MKRKLDEYFQAGVLLVWYVNPAARTVRVYTGPKRSVLLNETQELSGGEVLPGFTLSIREWFTEAQRSAAKS
jgi:Uma2 family endonuclease